MTWKIALALSSVLASVVCVVLPGCGSGGDDCTTAAAHQAECGATSANASSGTMMMEPVTCAGASLCIAQCINNSTCTEIVSNTPTFTKCLTDCQGK